MKINMLSIFYIGINKNTVRLFFSLFIVLSLLPLTSRGQSNLPSGDAWVDYASVEYDIFPNITCTANNSQLNGPEAKHYEMEWLGSLPNRKELAQSLSPINYFRKELPPVITIHGDGDNVAPYSQAVRLHSALDAPNELVTIKGAKHRGFNRQTLIDSFARVREFLRKYNVLD